LAYDYLFQHYASNPKIKAIENALEERGNTREGNCSDIITYVKSVVNSNKAVKVKQEVNNDNGASEKINKEHDATTPFNADSLNATDVAFANRADCAFMKAILLQLKKPPTQQSPTSRVVLGSRPDFNSIGERAHYTSGAVSSIFVDILKEILSEEISDYESSDFDYIANTHEERNDPNPEARSRTQVSISKKLNDVQTLGKLYDAMANTEAKKKKLTVAVFTVRFLQSLATKDGPSDFKAIDEAMQDRKRRKADDFYQMQICALAPDINIYDLVAEQWLKITKAGDKQKRERLLEKFLRPLLNNTKAKAVKEVFKLVKKMPLENETSSGIVDYEAFVKKRNALLKETSNFLVDDDEFAKQCTKEKKTLTCFIDLLRVDFISPKVTIDASIKQPPNTDTAACSFISHDRRRICSLGNDLNLHTDFDRDQILSKKNNGGFFIILGMSDCKRTLVVRIDGELRVFELKKGDLLFCEGFCIHGSKGLPCVPITENGFLDKDAWVRAGETSQIIHLYLGNGNPDQNAAEIVPRVNGATVTFPWSPAAPSDKGRSHPKKQKR